jgi:hypothetical protein
MREIRSSGSVEGVMGNHDSYSDQQPPFPISTLAPAARPCHLCDNNAMSIDIRLCFSVPPCFFFK